MTVAERGPLGRAHHHRVSRHRRGRRERDDGGLWLRRRNIGRGGRIQCELGQQERLDAAGGRELDADERAIEPGTHDGLYGRADCSGSYI